MNKLAYNRVLFKLSGELFKDGDNPFSFEKALKIGAIIKKCHEMGVKTGIVVGGGNVFRGREKDSGLDQVTADHIGMLATTQNTLLLEGALRDLGVEVRGMSAIPMNTILEPYCYKRMLAHFDNDKVVIFGAGTGNPHSSTDSAAALRAAEMQADVLVKFTDVDGVYDKDPNKFDDAKLLSKLSFDQVIELGLGVMDQTAFTFCKEKNIPIRVLSMDPPENFLEVVRARKAGAKRIGTLIR